MEGLRVFPPVLMHRPDGHGIFVSRKKITSRSGNYFFIATSGPGNFPKSPPTNPAIIFYCYLRIWQFSKIPPNRSGNYFFIAISGPDNFPKSPPTNPAIIFYCHLQTGQFSKIPPNRSGNYFLLLPPDPAIFLITHK
jgi:hypothetical protein